LPGSAFGKVIGSDVEVSLILAYLLCSDIEQLRKGGKAVNPLLTLSRGKGKGKDVPAEESAPTPEAKPKELTKAVAEPTPAASTSKPEKTGKLDFSKAKPKAEKKVAEAPSKAKKEVKVCETDSILGGNINVAAEAYRNHKRV